VNLSTSDAIRLDQRFPNLRRKRGLGEHRGPTFDAAEPAGCFVDGKVEAASAAGRARAHISEFSELLKAGEARRALLEDGPDRGTYIGIEGICSMNRAQQNPAIHEDGHQS
jgi:hypothetical protein